jgi:predicted MFS family arabinose efflux permease
MAAPAFGAGRGGLLAVVFGSTFLAMFSFSVLVVALPFRFQQLGFSVVEYGALLALYALGMLVTEGAWGAVAERVVRAAPLAALSVAILGLVVVLGIATSYPVLLGAFVAFGALVVFPVPLMRWLALTAGGPGTGGRGTGQYVLFFGLGLSAGAILGPILFVTEGYRADALVALVGFAVAFGLLATPGWKRSGFPPRSRGLRRDLTEVFTRPFAIAAALVTLAYAAYSLTSNFLQYYSVSLFGGTPTDAGFVIGAARGAQILAGFLLGRLVDRWGPGRSAPFGFALMVAGALGTFVAGTFAEMTLATLVFATGTGWLSASLLPLALGPVRPEVQSATVGVFGSFEDLGLLIGPLVISGSYAAYGPRSIFPLVAAIAGAGVVLAVLSPRFGARRPRVDPSVGALRS